MGRYCGAVCRLCRREGEKLFLKGERCYTNKCAIERREGGPGQHGRGRQSFSDYKTQLREKQKVKRIYGLSEKAFRKTYERVIRAKGVTGTQMLIDLESRLDNITYRLGFGFSRRESRQLVSHGHIKVNGLCVNIPSYKVSVGDIIEVDEGSKKNINVVASMSAAHSRMIPPWMTLDMAGAKGTVNAMPTREQLPPTIRERLIVELYSK